MVHVDSQVKDSPNSFRRRHSSPDAEFGSTLPKDSAVKSQPKLLKLIEECMNRQLSRHGLDYGYARICLKYHRGRVENDVSNRALPLPGHFDSRVKDSSNGLRQGFFIFLFFDRETHVCMYGLP